MNLSTVSAFKHIHPPDALELTDEQLRHLQKTLTDMLSDITDVCEKYGIGYELGGGSALGAVRQQGFIPWDDDIDLNMPRKDHDRFVKVFSEEYGDRYWIHTPQDTEDYCLTFTRVRKKGTTVRTREDFRNPEECGAFIDIFVIENTYDHPVLRTAHGWGCMALGFLQSCAKFRRDRKEMMGMLEYGDQSYIRSIRRVFRVKIAIGWLFSFLSTDRWTRITDRWYAMCRDGHSTRVTVPSGRNHFYGELYRREEICEYEYRMFEGRRQPVPAGYDRYLKRLYGDYMKIPEDAGKEKHIFYKPFIL